MTVYVGLIRYNTTTTSSLNVFCRLLEFMCQRYAVPIDYLPVFFFNDTATTEIYTY